MSLGLGQLSMVLKLGDFRDEHVSLRPGSCKRRPKGTRALVRIVGFDQGNSEKVREKSSYSWLRVGISSREFSILDSRVSRPFSFLDFPGNEKPNSREIEKLNY